MAGKFDNITHGHANQGAPKGHG